MELELDAQARKTKELAVELKQTNEGWSADGEKWSAERKTMRMKLELEVRRQFDKEREQHGEELEHSVTLIKELKEKLATLESAVSPSPSCLYC